MLSPAALATFAWFALEKQPIVAPPRTLNHTDIARAQRVIKENKPRKLFAGTDREVRISERDLNLVANYLLQRTGGSVKAKMRQVTPRYCLNETIRLPGNASLNSTMPYSEASSGGFPITR